MHIIYNHESSNETMYKRSFLPIKVVVLQNFSFITGDKTDFLSPMMFSI